MGLLDWLFGAGLSGTRNNRKRVFISFAYEDIQYRDYLVLQACDHRSPFDFINMSVKEPWPEHVWKQMCRRKIARCNKMIVLLSQHTAKSHGVRWEVQCAKELGVKMVAMYIKRDQWCSVPGILVDVKRMKWTWDNLERFLE